MKNKSDVEKGEKSEYEIAIDALIPGATKIANRKIKRAACIDSEDYSSKWNVVFHDTMNRLAAEAGLRSSRKYKKAA